MDEQRIDAIKAEAKKARDFPYEFFGDYPDAAIKQFQIKCHPDRWPKQETTAKKLFTLVSEIHSEYSKSEHVAGFRLCRKLARGNMCDVFLGWDGKDKRHVIVKRQRIYVPAMIKHEYETLQRFSRATDTDLLRPLQMIANPICVEIDNTTRQATLVVTRGLAGVPLSRLADHIGRKDLPGTAVVWVFRKLMIILSHLHANGICHGAVVPEHVLIDPATHNVQLCGMVHSGKPGEKFQMAPEGYRHYYAVEAKKTGRSFALDVLQAAMSLLSVAGTDTPIPVDCVIKSCMLSALSRPRAYEAELAMREAAGKAYGPPKFVNLPEVFV